MSDSKPWFLVMTPADANQPGSQWVRQGAVSRGKVVARPIAPEGWLALLVAIGLIVALPLVIWLSLVPAGSLSVMGAILATIVGVAIVIAGLVMLIRSRMTRLPPAG